MSLLKKLTLQSHDRTIIKDLGRVLEVLKGRYRLTLTDILRRNEDSLDHFAGLLDDIEQDCDIATQQSIVILRRKLGIADKFIAVDIPFEAPMAATPKMMTEKAIATELDYNQRQCERIALSIRVVVYHERLGLLCGRSLDVSLSGMRLEMECPVPDEGPLDLLFTLPQGNHQQQLYKIRAIIVSSRENRLGLMFISVEPETYAALEIYLGPV